MTRPTSVRSILLLFVLEKLGAGSRLQWLYGLDDFDSERALLCVRTWLNRQRADDIAAMREARATIDALSARCDAYEHALHALHREQEQAHPSRLLPPCRCRA